MKTQRLEREAFIYSEQCSYSVVDWSFSRKGEGRQRDFFEKLIML